MAARGGVRRRLGPADQVTLVRCLLACGVALLVAVSFARPVSVPVLVALSSVALALDAVDGWVARRTGTVSEFGARFDMEADAFLILVLSVYAAPTVGAWVLAIGAARYALLGADRVLPWLREPVPFRYWRKVVATIQGIVLIVAASGLLPLAWTRSALVVALVLLAESFGRDVWWLWKRHRGEPVPLVRPGSWRAPVLTAAAGVTVWLMLVLPDRVTGLGPGAALSIPLEGLLLVTAAVVLPRRARQVAAVGFGLVLALVVVVRVLDMGFHAVFDRPFDPLNDWAYLGPGVGVLGDSVGHGGAMAAVTATGVLVLALLVLLPLAALRLTAAAARHRRGALHGVAVLGVVWLLGAVAGLRLVPGVPLAATNASSLVRAEVGQVRADLADRQEFGREIAVDRFRGTPGGRLLTGLRGKDVLLVFVESYGRVAVQDTTFSPGIDRVLDHGTRRLRAAGFRSRSAFLTSPTFGAGSWLAHSTLQSGLWVDSQQRYDQLLGRDRLTLSDAFGRAGWRTVLDVPANTEDWPEGVAFYHADRLYDSRNVGYHGPAFGYAPIPDQYTLDAFRHRELAPRHRRPVMAEIDLVSSHHPWTPLPHHVPWRDVGDGSIYSGMPEQGPSSDTVLADSDLVRTMYGRSVQYSWRSLVSFVRRYGDDDTVLVVLGDHQPHSYVTGSHPGHDVPISVIAHDPAVMRRIAGWHWQSGLRPAPDAPVWRMDAFRDRFLQAYGP